jgi:signal peptidase II
MISSVVSLVGCDHATKLAAVEHLADRAPVSIAPGLLSLSYAENRDVGFHLLRWIPADARFWIIIAVGLVFLGGLGLVWARGRQGATHLQMAAFALIAGGAVGNLSDRIGRGYVVDFVHLESWPIFNMADVFLVAGAILLLLSSRSRASPTQGSPAMRA